jgi:hypothetical protein
MQAPPPAHVTSPSSHVVARPCCSSTYTSARLGYLKSAFSSRNSIHAFKNLLPLTCTLASSCATVSSDVVREGNQGVVSQHGFRVLGLTQLPLPGLATFSGRATCAIHKGNKAHERKGLTYLLMVSESPITQRCRFGRVMATAVAHQNSRVKCSAKRKYIPLSRLFSPKNPTSRSGLLRTVLTMTASFSRP